MPLPGRESFGTGEAGEAEGRERRMSAKDERTDGRQRRDGAAKDGVQDGGRGGETTGRTTAGGRPTRGGSSRTAAAGGENAAKNAGKLARSDAGTTSANSGDVDEANVEAPESPAFFEYWNQMDFVSWMGARIVESANGHATVYFEPGKHHRGAGVGGRAVTGAVQAYIFDIVTGAAVASLAHGTRPQVTVTLDVTFEHPAYEPPLTFEAHVSSGGKQIAFVDAVCTDAEGRVCSRARAIYRRFERRITGEEVDHYLKTHGPNASDREQGKPGGE